MYCCRDTSTLFECRKAFIVSQATGSECPHILKYWFTVCMCGYSDGHVRVHRFTWGNGRETFVSTTHLDRSIPVTNTSLLHRRTPLAASSDRHFSPHVSHPSKIHVTMFILCVIHTAYLLSAVRSLCLWRRNVVVLPIYLLSVIDK